MVRVAFGPGKGESNVKTRKWYGNCRKLIKILDVRYGSESWRSATSPHVTIDRMMTCQGTSLGNA